MASNSVQLKMGYRGTDEKRTYTIGDVADDDTAPNIVRSKIQTFNGYLNTTTATVFVSAMGASAAAITEAKIISTEETPIEGV